MRQGIGVVVGTIALLMNILGVRPVGAQTVAAAAAAGTHPRAVVLNSITNKIYVANGGSNNATIVDGASNAATAVEASTPAPTATVNWSSAQQTMDGWGGEDWVSAENLTSSQAAMFFSPSTGIGLEFVRTGNYACPETGSCAVSTSNVPDLVTLQEAAALGAKIELDIQGPPASLQYAGNFHDGTAGANGTCIPNSNWAAYAAFTVQWIQLLNAKSAPVTYLNVANEADITDSNSLGSCQWTAAGLDSYIGGTLGPALAAAGLSSVQVMLPSNSLWFGEGDASLATTCLNDPTCAQYITIASAHDYGTGGVDGTDNGYCCATASNPGSPITNKRIWQTEVNGGFTYNSAAGLWNWDPSMADALIWAHNIHDFLTVANASGWEYWQLADCCNSEAGAPFNDGLTTSSFAVSQRMYVVGQWSKFVRSGWHRVGVTNDGSMLITAFESPDGTQTAVVVVNNTASDSAQVLSVGTQMGKAAVPWITSATQSLAPQTSVAISSGTLTYTVPADSVVTFVGSGSVTGPPSGLVVAPH